MALRLVFYVELSGNLISKMEEIEELIHKRALVVDDSRMARQIVIKECKSFIPEMEYDEAVNGEEALEKMRSGKYDFVFLDLNMPVLDGIGVLSRLKDESLEFKVIVLSANFQKKVVERVKELGATDFIQKPPKAENIQETLERNNLL